MKGHHYVIFKKIIEIKSAKYKNKKVQKDNKRIDVRVFPRIQLKIDNNTAIALSTYFTKKIFYLQDCFEEKKFLKKYTCKLPAYFNMVWLKK